MSPTTIRTEEIRDVADLRRSVLAFRDGWERNPATMRSLGLLRRATHWIYDPDNGNFANAKFAGYRHMTVKRYALARRGHFDGNFSGNVNRSIARRLRQEWRTDPELSERLMEFANALAGEDALTGIDRTKWRFLIVPGSERPSRKKDLRNVHRDTLPPGDPDKEAELHGSEGGKRLVMHIRTERDSGLVGDIKEHWSAEDRNLACTVCGFSFFLTYGELGDGFVEAHHRALLSSRRRRSVSTVEHFDRVCSNCHRMLHRMGKYMSSSGLKKIVDRLRSKTQAPARR